MAMQNIERLCLIFYMRIAFIELNYVIKISFDKNLKTTTGMPKIALIWRHISFKLKEKTLKTIRLRVYVQMCCHPISFQFF